MPTLPKLIFAYFIITVPTYAQFRNKEENMNWIAHKLKENRNKFTSISYLTYTKNNQIVSTGTNVYKYQFYSAELPFVYYDVFYDSKFKKPFEKEQVKPRTKTRYRLDLSKYRNYSENCEEVACYRNHICFHVAGSSDFLIAYDIQNYFQVLSPRHLQIGYSSFYSCLIHANVHAGYNLC